MKIAILGASGYIGHNLIKKLIEETNNEIVAVSPNATSINYDNERLKKFDIDVFDSFALHEKIKECEVVYYLIHMMAQKKLDFAEAEMLAANSFCDAATESSIRRVIYLGGLGNDQDKLSKHLASRHKTGEIFRTRLQQVIEFRASMIIGNGSISYDIVTNLIHKLPVLTLPKWARTLTQPIGLEDALNYLLSAIDLKTDKSLIVEIGGPEKVSYGDLMKRYANWKKKKMIIVHLPVIPAHIAAWWLNLFTPKKHAKVGMIMVDSLSNPMVLTNNSAAELFPDIKPKTLEEVFV